jgi:hypothetical protein
MAMGEPEVDPVGSVPSWDNPRALSREEILHRARPLPPVEETVIDDLTAEEERVFWEAITSA